MKGLSSQIRIRSDSCLLEMEWLCNLKYNHSPLSQYWRPGKALEVKSTPLLLKKPCNICDIFPSLRKQRNQKPFNEECVKGIHVVSCGQIISLCIQNIFSFLSFLFAHRIIILTVWRITKKQLECVISNKIYFVVFQKIAVFYFYLLKATCELFEALYTCSCRVFMKTELYFPSLY